MKIIRDYFRYFPDTPDVERLGIWVAACGTALILPNTEYPPKRHPADHHFDWEKGRVLDSLQIILISAGSGWLETRLSGKKKIEAGTAFLVLPRVWHRYCPDPRTGWHESWMELRGRVVDDFLKSGALSPTSMIQKGKVAQAMKEIHACIHQKVCGKSLVHRPELSPEALRAIILLTRNYREHSLGGPLQSAVKRAEQYLAEHYSEEIDVQNLSRKLGVSYSGFRKSFLKQTGLSPWQYVIQLRIDRVRRLLTSSSATLDEIASLTGFSSAFHLSSVFKKAHGISPAAWRNKAKAHEPNSGRNQSKSIRAKDAKPAKGL